MNNFSHDLLTGLWLSAFFLLYRLQSFREVQASTDLSYELFLLQTGSLIGVLLTGIGRTISTRGVKIQEEGAKRKKLLVLKHIVLAVLFSVGTYFSFRWGLQR